MLFWHKNLILICKYFRANTTFFFFLTVLLNLSKLVWVAMEVRLWQGEKLAANSISLSISVCIDMSKYLFCRQEFIFGAEANCWWFTVLSVWVVSYGQLWVVGRGVGPWRRDSSWKRLPVGGWVPWNVTGGHCFRLLGLLLLHCVRSWVSSLGRVGNRYRNGQSEKLMHFPASRTKH